MKKAMLLCLAVFFCALTPAWALDNGLAKTPPMGWNSWNKFGCNVSEKFVEEMADAMVSSGMKALADYLHSKGLKFRLYSDAGTATCQGRPGSRGSEFRDARQYAAWGVDYLKYDWCNHSTQNVQASYAIMRDALKASGWPIVFSLCEWGVDDPWKWAVDIGNLWRTTGDIADCWDCTGV